MTNCNMRFYENKFLLQNRKRIAGIDEVGRGPLAGPLIIAAVVLPNDFSCHLIKDSKQLSAKQRYQALEIIQKNALLIELLEVDIDEIDQLNIYRATHDNMVKMIEKIQSFVDAVVIDAMPIKVEFEDILIESVIKGDQLSISIAAASIVAKCYRDDLMRVYHEQFPQYDFINNMGYGTKKHLQALEKHGYCKIHRKSFAPIKNMIKV